MPRARANDEQLARYLAATDDWDEVDRSAGWKVGTTANKGHCPCEQQWTVHNRIKFFDDLPDQDDIDDVVEKLKEPGRPVEKCAKPCAWVPTESWKQWRVFKSRQRQEWFVSAGWVIQWHCEKNGPRPD